MAAHAVKRLGKLFADRESGTHCLQIGRAGESAGSQAARSGIRLDFGLRRLKSTGIPKGCTSTTAEHLASLSKLDSGRAAVGFGSQ